MKIKKTDSYKPSFFQLIKWSGLAVLFMYLASLSNKYGFKIFDILNIICSVWCAFVAVAEAYLLHMGQDAINNITKEEE